MTSPAPLYVAVPGDLQTRTGGYEYDRRMVAMLEASGWDVRWLVLDGSFPRPTAAAIAAARETFALLPDGACVLADGLAFGAFPPQVLDEVARVRCVALVHHPLTLETGLEAAEATAFAQSERQALAVARGVVVTSHATAGLVQALGVSASRIAVVEPGTDAAPIAVGTSAGPVELLCVASVVPRKGHDTLIAAMAHLAPLEWHLRCVGSLDRDHALVDRLRTAVDDAGLSGRVTFEGEADTAQLERVYAGTDLFVFPTRYEGYGMVVAEALARGIPVVSTRTGAIGALLAQGAGVLVEADQPEALAAALAPLLQSRAALEACRTAARQVRVTLPTWAESGARMDAALHRFLS